MTRLAKLPVGQQRERTRPLSIQSTSCRIIEIKEIIVSGDNFIERRIAPLFKLPAHPKKVPIEPKAA